MNERIIWPRGPELVLGAGVLAQLGERVRGLGARHALIVTDPGIVAAGHVAAAERALEAAGVTSVRFEDVPENPDSDVVARAAAVVDRTPVEVFIGLGGGSAMDVAKGGAFVVAGGGRMEDYRGRGRARGRFLPIVVCPTTAGTGSETQSFALIEEAATGVKMACGDPRAMPRLALLDPVLMTSQPRSVTARAGIDAIGHAVEAAVTRVRNPISLALATEAFALGHEALPRCLDAAHDVEARASMQLAAALAGAAIECSMLGAAHALANPLTARHGIAHGQAVGVMLPHVIRFNAQDAEAEGIYARLVRAAGLQSDPDRPGEVLAAAVEGLLDHAGLERRLTALAISGDELEVLAKEAAEEWTAGFNPRRVDAEHLRALYEAAS